MRVFLSYQNLVRAATLAAIVTLMSLGRLVQGQMHLLLFIPVTFGLMMFVGGPLKLALATIHDGLFSLRHKFTIGTVFEPIDLLNDALKKYFGRGWPTCLS